MGSRICTCGPAGISAGSEAGYVCARAFILAELAASVEWQLHCALFPHRGGGDGLALLLLVVVDGVLYGTVFWLERRRPSPTGKLTVSNKAALVAVVMAAMVFRGEQPALFGTMANCCCHAYATDLSTAHRVIGEVSATFCANASSISVGSVFQCGLQQRFVGV